MASRKKPAAIDRQSATIAISLVPAYAIVFDHPMLSGHFAVGLTPEKAMISARGLIGSKFPMSRYDVTVDETTPDRFERVGVHYDDEPTGSSIPDGL